LLCDLPIGQQPDPDEVAWLPWRSYCATEQSMPSSPDHFIVEDYPETDIEACAELGAERQRQSYRNVYPDCTVTTTRIRAYTLVENPLACNGNVSPGYYIGTYVEAYEGTWEIACPGSPAVSRTSVYGDKYFVREPVGDGELVAARNYGQPGCGLAAGNPINIATGNKYQRQVDISLPGGLEFVRHYNSSDRGRHGFGRGWRGSFSRNIDFVGTADHTRLAVILTRDDGRVDYWRIEDAAVIPPPDARGRLEAAYQDGRLAGFAYYEDGVLETYGPLGRLQALESDRGDRLVFRFEGEALAAVTDASGRSLVFHRDAEGRIERISSADGSIWRYFYDPQGRLVQVEHAGGMTETYHYEDTGFPYALTGITDEKGSRIRSWAYDALGRAVLSTRGDLQSPVERHSVAYHADGTTTTTGPLQHSVHHRFEAGHGVARFASASAPCDSCVNRVKSITRDQNGNRDLVTDFRGVVSDYDYSPDNLLLRMTEAVGEPLQREVIYEWDPRWRKPGRITQDGKTIEFSYNSRGQVLGKTVTDMQSLDTRRWTYAYFEAPAPNALVGKLRSVDGPRVDVDDRTTYEYYESDHAEGHFRAGDLKAVINPLGHRSLWLQYDANGRPLQISDANGALISLSWHPRGWLISRSIDGASTRFDYDPNGNVKRVSQPGGSYLDFRYDGLNRLVALSDALGNRVEYTLDSDGNRIAEKTFDAAGVLRRQRLRQYDSRGRLTAETDGTREETRYAYDEQQNLVGQQDANGDVTALAYDVLNRLDGVVDAAMTEIRAEYDLHDRPVRLVDPLGNATQYEYDALGNRIRAESADRGATHFEHDSAGNRTAATDARGVRRAFTYDALNRLTAVLFPDRSLDVRFEYDGGANGVGRLTRMIDAAGTVDYQYDVRGNLVSETRHFGAGAYEVAYSYDAANQLTQIRYPGGLVLDRSVDAAGRTVLLSSAGGVLAEDIRYEPFGPVRSFRYGNGLAYSADRELDYSVRRVQSGPALDWSFSRDGFGNILSMADAASSVLDQAFAYDERHRLVSARGAYGDLYFDYDANGNRLRRQSDAGEEALSYTPYSNRLTTQGRWNITRDSAGNRILKIDAGGSGQALLYGDHGRLSRVTALDGASETVLAEYVYDGLGRRAMKTVGAETTHYIYDPAGHLLGEYPVGSPGDQKEYVYLDGSLLAIVTRTSEWRTPPGLDRVMDNGDPGTSSTGNWRARSGNQAWAGDYLYANRSAGTTYRWSTVLPEMDYRLYAWWPAKNNQSSAVVYRVSEGSGETDSVIRSQKSAGGRWQLLGEYHSAGGENSVELGSESNRFVADAVRWAEITEAEEVVTEESFYVHSDHLATPRRVTDQEQAVVWRWDSTPFGLMQPDEDPDGDGAAFVLNLRFAGQYHDAESGMNHNRFRTYDPGSGRYLEPDPAGLRGGLNPFVYALDNPLGWVDPLGLMPVGEWISRPKFNISDYGVTGLDVVSPYLDEWGFLRVFRIQGYASGYINLDVLCRDGGECGRQVWQVHERIGLSYSGYKDFGPNLIATGAGVSAGPLAGAATGIVTFGGAAMTALLDLLREIEARGGDKLRWLFELGPTAICLGNRQ
jgi:RHS repeat-associated protein